jgi:hypothetical protein
MDRNGANVGRTADFDEPAKIELLELVSSRCRAMSIYGQAIRQVTNPILGRGRIAEALLPVLRRNQVPRSDGSTGFAYVVVVCDKLSGLP